jgi:heterodisulfide reductase subunit A
MYLSKFAHQATEKLPGVSITEFCSDLCLPGKESQGFFNRMSGHGNLERIHMREPDSIEIVQEDENTVISYTDIHGESATAAFDMVVLAPAMEGARDAQSVADVFDISLGEGGFFLEENTTVAPVSTAREGIFAVGCAQGPKDIQNAVAQGQAAAGRILSRLVPGEKLTLEATTAEVDTDQCSRCKLCVGLCFYKAIVYDGMEQQVRVNGVLCRGCGVCAAACPSGAIKANHFTDEEISAEMRGLLQQ